MLKRIIILLTVLLFYWASAVQAQVVRTDAATTCLTNTAAAGTGVTLTITAPGAGTFQYITYLEVIEYASVATVGAAVPILVTTTNIVGTPTLTFDTAVAIGQNIVQKPFIVNAPLKASAAATAVTIVAPATTSIIWRLNACWYVGQ